MLKNKVVVVTGGAGLLGQEFVRAIVKNNGIAIIADIDVMNASKVKDKLSEKYQTDSIDVVELDINSKSSVQNVINYLDGKYYRIDALINNAYPRNKNYGKHFFDVEYKDFVDNIGANLGGYFLSSQLFAKYFQKQGAGNIINISSIYGITPPKFEIYNGTSMTTPVEYIVIKSSLIHLTKYMAKYFKGMNIRVNAISPGGVLDGQPEEFLNAYNRLCLEKGMLDKNDLNGTIVFLLSDMGKYINGQNIVVDDGFTL